MNGDISIVFIVFYNLFIPGGGTTLLWHLLSISLSPAFHRPPLKQPGLQLQRHMPQIATSLRLAGKFHGEIWWINT